jgi:L-asparagine transporter-like permease
VQGNHAAKLSVWQLVMLALGSAVGGSFFLGTAITLQSAGPAALIAFVVGGLLIFLILRALSEMTVAKPTNGSFREYAENAFGPMASFVVGWVYWSGLVLALSSEATATALFARLWLPQVPVWLMSLVVILGVTALNFLSVRLFSVIESVMAAVKVLAIIAFVLIMLAVLAGLLPGRPPGRLVRSEPFLPAGLGGLAGSMLVVLFSYAGFEVMGLAAPEARDPIHTVPRAVLLTVVLLVGLYMSGVAVMLPVLPISAVSRDVSPLVRTFQVIGFSGLAAGLNLIVTSASLSTMVAAMFGLGRMLQSLAEEGQAPAVFKRLTPAGTPRNAIVASAAGMLVGVVLAFLLPKGVYLFLASSGAFSLLFAYLMILGSQLVIRRKEGCRPGVCQMPWYPYGTWLGIALVLLAMAAMPLVPGQGAGLLAGLGLLAVIAAAYLLTRRSTPRPTPAPDPAEQEDTRLLLR